MKHRRISQRLRALFGGVTAMLASRDPRILREFREAVDYVRKATWVVQEWQARQLQKHDPQTVLPLLTAERIRRATQLCDVIIADSATHEVTRETVGIIIVNSFKPSSASTRPSLVSSRTMKPEGKFWEMKNKALGDDKRTDR